MNWPRLLLLVVDIAMFAVSLSAADRPLNSTRIVLDPNTFPKISRPLLQDTADQVAKTVDELIPGGYPNGAPSTILCFVANDKWAEKPRAFVGKPWKIEPRDAYKYNMRIAVTPEVLPGAWQRFVFQLAHELAHQKMDARADNNALEAFAVAVSLEVLHRLSYDGYRESNERFYTQFVPREVMSAVNRADWATVGLYLRYEWREEPVEEWDQTTHFVAAMALRKAGNFPWERLLDIGASAQCGSSRRNGHAQYCPLSPASLEDFPEAVKEIVSPSEMKVVIARIGMPERDGESLTFRENGKWVSLRWSRRSDPLMPDGFRPIE